MGGGRRPSGPGMSKSERSGRVLLVRPRIGLLLGVWRPARRPARRPLILRPAAKRPLRRDRSAGGARSSPAGILRLPACAATARPRRGHGDLNRAARVRWPTAHLRPGPRCWATNCCSEQRGPRARLRTPTATTLHGAGGAQHVRGHRPRQRGRDTPGLRQRDAGLPAGAADAAVAPRDGRSSRSSSTSRGTHEVFEAVEELRADGYRVALDDFLLGGPGHPLARWPTSSSSTSAS